MAVITLTSDWNNEDYYISTMKGAIHGMAPGATIIDISHRVSRFSSSLAAFIVRSSYKKFPEGSVHIIAVNCEASSKHPYVAILHDGHYFITVDNGIFGLMFEQEAVEIILLEEKETSSFPELTVFAPAAAHLILGKPLFELGSKTNQLQRQMSLLPAFDHKSINGNVIYIDTYGNLVTNITKELFEKAGKGRAFEILPQTNFYKINKINKRYNDTNDGEVLAIFNSLGLLEIAQQKGNMAELLKVTVNATIRVKFFENDEKKSSGLLDHFK